MPLIQRCQKSATWTAPCGSDLLAIRSVPTGDLVVNPAVGGTRKACRLVLQFTHRQGRCYLLNTAISQITNHA